MALTWKIYLGRDLIGAVKTPEVAAELAGRYLDASVKHNGRVVWREGKEEFTAHETPGAASITMRDRAATHNREAFEKVTRARA